MMWPAIYLDIPIAFIGILAILWVLHLAYLGYGN